MSFKKSKSSWLMLVIAIFIAFIAFWLANNYLKNKEEILKNQLRGVEPETVSIVVAATDVMMGDVVSSANMAIADVNAEYLSLSVVPPGDFGVYEGQVVKHNMIAGEPLLSHYVAGLGIESFSDLLREGERAVTLEIDNLNSASGMALPGDIVDLLLVTEKAVEDAEGLADEPLKQIEPLLQKVRILSVDNISLVSQTQDFKMYGYDKNFLEYSTITVGVKFKDAAKVILAKELGEIVFMLRNSTDETNTSSRALISDFNKKINRNDKGSYKLYTSSLITNGEIKPVTVTISSEQKTELSRSIAIYSNSSELNKSR